MSDLAPRRPHSPLELSWRRWKAALWRVKDEVGRDNLVIVAAGVAFYGLMSAFPALAAMVSLYGLVADPADLVALTDGMRGAVPAGFLTLMQDQLREITAGDPAALSVGALFGVLVSLWSANGGMKSLITGLNIAYDTEEDRGFLKLNAVSLAITFSVLVGGTIAGIALALSPLDLAGLQGRSGAFAVLVEVVRYVVLAVGMMGLLSAVYRFGPSRSARWRWVSPGSVAGGVLWALASGGFGLYAANFGSYNETYGTIGGVVVGMTWIWLTALVALLGAELNAELERGAGRLGEPRRVVG